MPSGSILSHFLNGWVNTSSISSTGASAGGLRRLIVSQSAIIRMTDSRM